MRQVIFSRALVQGIVRKHFHLKENKIYIKEGAIIDIASPFFIRCAHEKREIVENDGTINDAQCAEIERAYYMKFILKLHATHLETLFSINFKHSDHITAIDQLDIVSAFLNDLKNRLSK